ncbi:hypothetical protein DFH09DRAFT_1335485 [Mycena vulgaris]|nr:hypothetical protein DFH09DRAFT_1335485 [Mycena vulgaris]
MGFLMTSQCHHVPPQNLPSRRLSLVSVLAATCSGRPPVQSVVQAEKLFHATMPPPRTWTTPPPVRTPQQHPRASTQADSSPLLLGSCIRCDVDQLPPCPSSARAARTAAIHIFM